LSGNIDIYDISLVGSFNLTDLNFDSSFYKNSVSGGLI